MSGMVGWLSFGDNLQHQYNTLIDMIRTMALRGPNGEGIWISGPIALGHRRLPIIDIENGHQPMIGHDRQGHARAVVSYVGEIYNYLELRKSLIHQGHSFDTKSDTEVILKSYIEWGSDFVERLNGMYGLALWDIKTRQLLLVRDRMGIKPLYYYPTSKGIIFGSEPKAIIANPIVPRRLNVDGLRELLALGKTPGSAIFSDIYEVQPGEYLSIDINGIRKTRYWSLKAQPHTDDLETTITHTRTLLEDIIAHEMISDAPLSVLLSGGLDSSAVTALAQRHLTTTGDDTRIKTFSLDFKAYDTDTDKNGVQTTPDSPFVKDFVNHTNTQHQHIILDSKTLGKPLAHQQVIRALDMLPAYWSDLHSSLYGLFRGVSSQSTVVLSGEGADELFGGYRCFHDLDAISEKTFPWESSSTRLFDDNEIFKSDVIQKLHMSDFIGDSYATALKAVPRLPGENKVNARIREITYFYLTRFVQTLLEQMERLSMAVGLEVRFPFCDHRLVEYAFNIPWEMKSFDKREKSILRTAVQDLLPSSIIKRTKTPYPAIQEPDYEAKLRRRILHIIEDHNSPVLEIINPVKVKEMLSSNSNGSLAFYKRMTIERAIMINNWLREYNIDINLC